MADAGEWRTLAASTSGKELVMLKKVCAGCARLATAGLVGLVVARFFRKRHEVERKPFIHRLIPH